MNETVIHKLNSEKITIWLIILTAAILRFFNLGEMSLSNDELSSLVRVRYDSFSEMISNGVYIDFHPAGLQSFLYYWVKIFGDDTFILRFPFVISSLVSIWLIYRIGKKWYNDLTAFLSASAFAFLIFTILYSQLARMYSPGIMFSLLTVYFWTNYLFPADKKNRNRSWFGWIISMSAALHLHYFSFLFVGIVGISGFFLINRGDYLKYFLGGVIALLTFIPSLPVFIAQIKIGDIGGWLGPPSEKFLIDFIFELFNRSILICFLVIFLFLFGILFGRKKMEVNRWRVLSLSWFFVSFFIAYLYSIFRHPILMFSTLLFVTPFLLLYIFSFVPEFLKNRKSTLITVLIFSLVLIYDTVVPGKFYSTYHFGVFHEVAKDLKTWTKKYGKKNVPVVINVINPEYLNYYLREMEEPPLIVADRIEKPSQFNRLFSIVSKSESPYFAYAWCNSLHPLEIPEIIKYYYPYLIERKNYYNAASYLFGKHQSDSVINTQLFSSLCDFENNSWFLDFNNVSTEQFYSGINSQKMNIQYSASLIKKISEIPGSGYRYISFSAQFFATEEIGNVQMAISFDRQDIPFDYNGVFLSEFNLMIGQWQTVILSAALPKDYQANDVFKAYVWNPSNKLFYLDDLKVEIHSEVDPYER